MVIDKKQLATALALGLLLTSCSGDRNKKETYSFKSLPTTNQFKDSELALRNALPPTGLLTWEVEQALYEVKEHVDDRQWEDGKESITYALDVVARNSAGIVDQAPPTTKEATRKTLQDLRTSIRAVEDAIYKKDQGIGFLESGKMFWAYDRVLLALLAEHQPQVDPTYAKRPLLKGGWVLVEFDTDKGKFTLVLDGFNAPVTAGNFLDLVKRGFYNQMPISRAEKNFLVQTGDREGKGGFVDPATGKIRYLPLELRPARASRTRAIAPVVRREVGIAIDRYKLDPLKLRAELKLIYEKYAAQDVEAPFIYNQEVPQDQPLALLFTPPGTFAMARIASKPDSGSSQFFLSFADPELTPPGSNVEDGKYSVFGYLTSGVKNVRKLQVGDMIKSARILNCTEAKFTNVNLVDYTATTLNVEKLAKGKLEMSCLPVGTPQLVNTPYVVP